MSGKRAKRLRREFHKSLEDADIQLYSPEYKKLWREFKKNNKSI